MTDEDMDNATEYDADDVTSEMTDSELDEYLDDDGADAVDADDADWSDLGGDDEPTAIPQMTAEQLASDARIRAKNRRDPSRIADNMHEQVGPQIAAARWNQYLESERQASIDATSPDAEAERVAKAVAGVEEWLRVEDESNDAGFISGEGSEHDADDAKRRFANAKERWRDWCADPNN